jgi:cobalt-zinc-cadmium efflux system outer membrane protein
MLIALARLSDEIYRAQIELVAGGQAAAYEPLQMRVFAVQARNAVIAAHYQVVAAGRQLGAAIGMPDAETFRIGSEAESVPLGIEFHAARTFLLENHTELRTLRNLVVQSQFRSRLEYIKPRIPDVTYYQTVQHSYEVGPFVNSTNFQISAPIPIFDRNQGNILAQESSIISNERSYGAQQNDLIRQLAMILARFETARAQARNYRQQMLPDQARTYRGVYSRYREAGPGANDDVNFGDVIVAQQMLVTAIVGYADVLQEMWQSYVAAAEILQIDDLSLMAACFGIEE